MYSVCISLGVIGPLMFYALYGEVKLGLKAISRNHKESRINSKGRNVSKDQTSINQPEQSAQPSKSISSGYQPPGTDLEASPIEDKTQANGSAVGNYFRRR